MRTALYTNNSYFNKRQEILTKRLIESFAIALICGCALLCDAKTPDGIFIDRREELTVAHFYAGDGLKIPVVISTLHELNYRIPPPAMCSLLGVATTDDRMPGRASFVTPHAENLGHFVFTVFTGPTKTNGVYQTVQFDYRPETVEQNDGQGVMWSYQNSDFSYQDAQSFFDGLRKGAPPEDLFADLKTGFSRHQHKVSRLIDWERPTKRPPSADILP
jgi:hypothetical protein